MLWILAPTVTAALWGAEPASEAPPFRHEPTRPTAADHSPLDEGLLESGKPSPVALIQLLRQFSAKDPAVREAVVRRLAPYPDLASAGAIKTLREGKLAARLAALELLREWRAPIDGLDPWIPKTITPDRLAALEKWSQQTAPKPAGLPEPKELSGEQLAEARRQIDRMLKADDGETAAIRHRLAGLGASLLPEVYARLSRAATDADRQRLLALRYRLVASDRLAVRWPDGLVRLASGNPKPRQEAAEELARLATEEDQPLLLELFSDQDPLVREISLRGLQHIGGDTAVAALVRLLGDPEPNVRAAVLKQLAEAPRREMVPKVAEYLKNERDIDLVVHGIRFLKAAGGTEALKSLMGLLRHESWQVRAEAAEGIGKAESFRGVRSGISTSDSTAMQLKVDACVALLDLLTDTDAFVVSRAVEGLSDADMAVAVEPLAKAVLQHPDLAPKIVEILAEGTEMRPRAVPHLRKFANHERPAVRAAAVSGLVTAAPDDIQQELAAAMADADRSVRIAAVSGLFKILDGQRREAWNKLQQGMDPVWSGARSYIESADGPVLIGRASEPGLVGRALRLLTDGIRAIRPSVAEPAATEKPKPESNAQPGEKAETTPGKDVEAAPASKPVPGKDAERSAEHLWDDWLKEAYAGRRRPAWMSAMVAPLEKMLNAEAAEERLGAAMVLVAFGKGPVALPVLTVALGSHPESFDRAVEVLPWLLWEERLKLFDELRGLAPGDSDLHHLVSAFCEVPDSRAAEPLWRLLAEPKLTPAAAGALQNGLRSTYFGRRWGNDRMTPAARRELTRAASARAASGAELQRLVALTLLLEADPEAAAQLTAKLADDQQLSPEFRTDAFQVLLAAQTKKKAAETAIAALKGSDVARRRLALTHLATDRQTYAYLRETLSLMSSITQHHESGKPIVPEPPPGLGAGHVRPLLNDSDPRIAAQAGYLLALLGAPEGLPPLLRYWREHKKERGDDTDRYLYRAIAALDDSAHVPVLQQIYHRLGEYEVSEFYWTIRIMSGPEILKLRKQIRDEVGMDRLR